MVDMIAVGKIDARHVETGVTHLEQDVDVVRRRSERRYNLGPAGSRHELRNLREA